MESEAKSDIVWKKQSKIYLMAKYQFTQIIIIIMILFPLNTMQTPISPETINEPGFLHETHLNPCFLEPDTASCIKHIAWKRHISVNAALTLKQNAEKLYAATQEPQPFSVYDGRAVWIACLASKGSLRPGPDSDCAACGSVCTEESRLEICDLFCSWAPTLELSTDMLTLKANEKTKTDTTDGFITESSSFLAKVQLLVIAIPCGMCVIIIGGLLIIIILKRYTTYTCIMTSKSQQESKMANRAVARFVLVGGLAGVI